MKARIVFIALLSAVLFTPPAAAEPPALFVKLMFAHYSAKDYGTNGYDPCAEYCEADFNKLIKVAHRKNLLDYDPVCQCRKGGDKYMMFMGAAGPTQNDFRATMAKVGSPGTWVLLLRWSDGDWKIHDVLEPRGGKQVSIRERLASAGS